MLLAKEFGGYFSFGAKPFVGKILFGKPGDSSAPDDKKFAHKQGGPIIKTSGVEERWKTSRSRKAGI